MNFNVEDRINLAIQADEVMKEIIQNFQNYIKSETLTTDIKFDVVNLEDKNSLEHEIEKQKLKINLSISES